MTITRTRLAAGAYYGAPLGSSGKKHMRSSTWMVLGTALLSVSIAGGTWLWRDTSTEAPAPENPVRARAPSSKKTTHAANGSVNAAMLRRLSELDARLAELEGKTLEPDDQRKPELELEAPSAERPTPPSASEIRAENTALETRIEQALSAEPVDPAWAASTEVSLTERMVNADLQGTTFVDEVRCRGTHCRLLVRHVDDAARERFEEFAAHAGMGSLTIPRNWPANAAGEPTETLVYFVRRGHDRPEHPVRAATQNGDEGKASELAAR